MEHERLEQALAMLGDLLAESSEQADVLVVGGASLLLLGLTQRPTADVDIAGFSSPVGYRKADVLPDALTTAVADVADALGLDRQWLNNGPASLLDFGLPRGFAERVTIRTYGALQVHLPGHDDLVAFKLYAAVDQGVRSKHFADLVALEPTDAQLLSAAAWTRTHDPSPGYLGELVLLLGRLGLEVSDADL